MLLGFGGRFVQVGAPEESLPPFNAFSLIGKNATVGGSSIGSPQEIRVSGSIEPDSSDAD